MFLSVIIPAYNEQKRLPKTLFDVDAYLRKQPYEYEIVVVDDGSSDATVKTVKELMTKIPGLRVLENDKNRGKGYVVRQGLLSATGEQRLFMDADNSTAIYHLTSFLPELKNYDIIIGSRALRESVMDPAQPWPRRLLGGISKCVLYGAVGMWGLRDTQCGFKLFSKKAIQEILPKCTINGWVFDAEILKIANILGYKIKEMPVVWRNDPRSTVKLANSLHIVADICKITLNVIFGKYKPNP